MWMQVGSHEQRHRAGVERQVVNEMYLDPPVGLSWLDYPTLLIGFQTGHPLDGPGMCFQRSFLRGSVIF